MGKRVVRVLSLPLLLVKVAILVVKRAAEMCL